jgi:protein-tyrosine phosphatase
VGLLAGALTIGHRPRLRALTQLRDGGVTHIVTVLSRPENPDAIAAAAQRAGLAWFWIDLGSTKSLPARRKPEIVEALRSLEAILGSGGRIYLHCSAGIHRTGMIAAALLFHLGCDDLAVTECLKALRPVTAEGVGAERIEWARSFAPK